MSSKSEPLADSPRERGAAMVTWRRWSQLLFLAAAAAVLVLYQLGTSGRLDRLRESIFGPSHERWPVRGIDVSHHQGKVDWNRVREAGYVFAYLKATEGADFRDTRFHQNWVDARAAGLVTGAYHFFTFCAPGTLQADHFIAAMRGQEHVLPLGVDVEFAGNCKAWASLDEIQDELRVFVERVEAVRGEKPLLYTALDQYDELIPTSLRDHALWIRSLWGEPDLEQPWLFWQYSDSAQVPGIDGLVDLDAFAGDRTEWNERFGP